MFSTILFILGLVLLVIVLFLVFKYRRFRKYLLDNFKTNSCCVYGKKRKGKDLVFQYVIKARKDFYYANISYGGKYKIVTLGDCTVEPNTYENFIHGDFQKIKRTFYEGKDIYFSDIGNSAPSQYDSLLHRKYPSLPIFHSLSGHLYDNRFHCNAQTLERIWKPIREQADFFVYVRGTVKVLGLIFITYMTTYDKYESAKQYLTPLKKIHFNKFSKADYERYYAVNGDIRRGYIINFRWNLKYNTRAFENIILKGKRKYYKK